MLKEAKYHNDGYPIVGPEYGRVTYVIIGRRCIFSGLDGPGLSTINYAEDIISAITAQEGVDPLRLTFYDLQTRRGYQGKVSGEYEFDELKVEPRRNGRTFVAAWYPRECLAALNYETR